MKRVLVVLSNLRNNNGVASCMMNYITGVAARGYSVDFFVLQHTDSTHIETLGKLGCGYFALDRDGGSDKRAFISSLVNKGNYDIIHVNIVYRWAFEFLRAAKKAGIPVRILHSHSPLLKDSISNFRRSVQYTEPCNILANHYIACTKAAGKTIFFLRRFTILRNAVSVSRYAFDPEAREKYRSELGITDKFVIGTSCRHSKEKNPFFLIDVFKAVHDRKQESVLLWVGYGPLKEQVEQYAAQKGIADSVIMLGNRNDMNKLYSAMDAFALPSLHEGLGMVYIEAQCNGLYCFASDRIYKDTDVTGNIEYLPLKNAADIWAERIVSKQYPARTAGYLKQIRESGYDLESEKNALADYYRQLTDGTTGDEQ